MKRSLGIAAAVAAVAVFSQAFLPLLASAQTQQPAAPPAPVEPAAPPARSAAGALTVSGVVVDAQSGLALTGVRLTTNGPVTGMATTDQNGFFRFDSLTPGLYAITADLNGYQRTLSSTITVTSQSTPSLTLSMQRSTGAGNNLRVIGTTSVTAAQSLQRSTVIYKSISPENVINQGQYRIGDALVNLPGINDGSSQTASPADDITLVFRGIGTLETTTLIDGHPVAYGTGGGYNFEISPPFAFRNVIAVYGTGASELYPVNAIGGVVDMLTLAPTTTHQTDFTQQFGTWTQLGSALQATGPLGKFGGYAAAASVLGTNGPFGGLNLYSPTASQDPASPGYWQLTGQYPVSNATVTRSLLGKVVLNTSNTGGKVTLTSYTSAFYDNKTGNGDNDYLPYSEALNRANNNLAGAPSTGATYNLYTQGPVPQPVCADASNTLSDCANTGATNVQATCGAGLIPQFNANGIPSGAYATPTHPNGSTGQAGALPKLTDPANPNNPTPVASTNTCFTPQQAAQQNAGWQGAGQAFQTYNISDYSADYTTPVSLGTFRFSGFSDIYRHHYDRSAAQPYFASPGDNSQGYTDVLVNSGFQSSISFEGTGQNTLQLGAFYDNDVYTNFNIATVLNQASAANEVSVFARDVYRFKNAPLTAYLNLWQKYSSITNSSLLDPRLALVYSKPNDVFRISAGSTSTQPAIETNNQPFIANAPSALAGVSNPCDPNNPSAIGSTGGGGTLRPERAVGEEFAYGHRFGNDSLINLTVYNYNIYNYISSLTAPLTVTGLPGASALSPASLQAFLGFVQANCPSGTNPFTVLGISGPVNIASLRARGVNISGSQRFLKRAVLDYDYDINSSVVTSADPTYFATNSTSIQNSQVAGTPLHKWNVGLLFEFPHYTNLHFGYHNIEANNPKNLPTYGFWDAQLNGRAGPGKLAIGVNNLFNQRADYRGLIGQGYALPTNSFASGTPQATEQFSLPYRTIDFTFTIGTR